MPEDHADHMPLSLSPLDAAQFSPVVARVVGPTAQGPAKLMAARGLVPMGPRDLVTVLYQLSLDSDARIAEMAKNTAAKLPENILAAALADALDPRILHYYAELILDRPPLLEKLLLNRSVHDETLVRLAARLGERELELLAANQERLLACPAIIEAIYFNKHARMSTVERLLEMAVRNNIELARIPEFREIAVSILGGEAAGPADSAAVDDAFAAAAADEGPVGGMELDGDQPAEKSTCIGKMSLVQKLRLATVGSPGARAVLLRDANRTVALAAIASPAVTDQEAARHAASRSLPEEIIRYIAGRKDWQKNYQVKVALVNNPKCPLPTSMHLLPHLFPRDLKALVRSKNIPSALAQAAKEVMRKKNL